ncbi:hypothetical protein OC835_006232, partial [Tilletia horrida]
MLIKQLHEEHPLQPREAPSSSSSTDHAAQPATPSFPSAAADRKAQKAFFAQRQQKQHQQSVPQSSALAALPLPRSHSLPIRASTASSGSSSFGDAPTLSAGSATHLPEPGASSSSSHTGTPSVNEYAPLKELQGPTFKRRRLLASGSWSDLSGNRPRRSETAPVGVPPAPTRSPRTASRSILSDEQQGPHAQEQFRPVILPRDDRRTSQSSASVPTAELSSQAPSQQTNHSSIATASSSSRVLAHAIGNRPGQFAQRKLAQALANRRGSDEGGTSPSRSQRNTPSASYPDDEG